MDYNTIKSNWINGNKREAHKQLYALKKPEILIIIQQALINFYTYSTPECFSNDLQILLEIIRYGAKND